MADFVRRVTVSLLEGLHPGAVEIVVGDLEVLIENRDLDEARDAVVPVLVGMGFVAAGAAAERKCDDLFAALGFDEFASTAASDSSAAPAQAQLPAEGTPDNPQQRFYGQWDDSHQDEKDAIEAWRAADVSDGIAPDAVTAALGAAGTPQRADAWVAAHAPSVWVITVVAVAVCVSFFEAKAR
jgi:hypothetical protein